MAMAILILLLILAIAVFALYITGYVHFGKPQEGDACIPVEFKDNATKYVIDDESNCVVSNCASGFTLSEGKCVAVEAVEDADEAGDECIPNEYVDGGLDYKFQALDGDGALKCTPTACEEKNYDIDENSQLGNTCNAKYSDFINAPDGNTDVENKLLLGDAKQFEVFASYNAPVETIKYRIIECNTNSTLKSDGTTCECNTGYSKDDDGLCVADPDAGTVADPADAGTVADPADAGTVADPADSSGTTGTYTPRRSRYSLRYNSKKLEGII